MNIENDSPVPNSIATGSESASAPRRTIRSYSLRQGRLTAGQQNALETLWPIYGLPSHRTLDAPAIFGREAPVVVEIGFGNGESLVQMALDQPDTDFVGIEVHRPGIGHLLLQLKDRAISNVRIYGADAVEILTQNVADESLTGVNLFFPDPWPKNRHHKRRLVNADFLKLIVRKLKPNGFFHAATDWQDYAEHMLGMLKACSGLRNSRGTPPSPYSTRPLQRPLTKFEARGRRLGHNVWDLIFTRC